MPGSVTEKKRGKKLLIWGIAIVVPIVIIYMNLGYFMYMAMSVVMGSGDDASEESLVQLKDLPAAAQDQIIALPDSKLSVSKIGPIPDVFPSVTKESFVKYTQVIAPNGKPINIFAQAGLSDSQILHARDVLVFYLTDLPGSKYGSDKSDIANQMANNNAVLMLLNGSDGDVPPPAVNGQPLYDTELIVEGSKAYIENDYENHRDASLEEILHFVHDNGIGIDISGYPTGVRPEYQAQVRAAATNALPENEALWASNWIMSGWLWEIREEGSITQEYLASVVDSYYGMWGAWNGEGAMWGGYIAKTREDVKEDDPMGAALMPAFFGDYLTYDANLDSDFKGTFYMSFDASRPYTHKSQYLVNVSLTGSNNANITGNDQANVLSGNDGDNVLDGGEGIDTVYYTGGESDYEITYNADGTITVVGQGTDTLINIENVKFNKVNLT